MYVVVVGGGRVGRILAELLIAHGHDVVVIEKDKRRARELAQSELDILVIQGDATDLDVLQDAEIETADVVAAVTDKDEVNLAVSLIAKEEFGVERVVSRVTDDRFVDVFRRLGVDAVVNPDRSAAQLIEKAITRPNLVDMIMFGRGEAELLEFEVTEDSRVSGKKISEIPADCVIVAIYRDDELELPRGDTEINPGDRVLVLALRDKLKKVEKLFKGRDEGE
ncbi:potassium channel family protein [Methanopyrus sp.]